MERLLKRAVGAVWRGVALVLKWLFGWTVGAVWGWLGLGLGYLLVGPLSPASKRPTILNLVYNRSKRYVKRYQARRSEILAPLNQSRGEYSRALILVSGVVVGLLTTYVLMGGEFNWMLWLAFASIVGFGSVALYVLLVVYPLNTYTLERPVSLDPVDINAPDFQLELIAWKSSIPSGVKWFARWLLRRRCLLLSKGEAKGLEATQWSGVRQIDYMLLANNARDEYLVIDFDDIKRLHRVPPRLLLLSMCLSTALVLAHIIEAACSCI